MNTITRRAVALALFCACLCLSLRGVAQTTGPVITIGLADPASFSKILPLGDTVTPANYYKGRALIFFKAELTSSQKNIIFASINVPHASGSMFSSATNHTFIGAGWDVSKVASGTQATVTVIALDNAGHTSIATRTVTLRK